MDSDVYDLVKMIPRGKVTTYREIARKLGITAHEVGWALNRNQNLEGIPCYRVVMSDGSIGGYILGVNLKQRMLSEDGVGVVKGMVINFEEKLFRFL